MPAKKQRLEVVRGHSEFLSHFSIPPANPTACETKKHKKKKRKEEEEEEKVLGQLPSPPPRLPAPPCGAH